MSEEKADLTHAAVPGLFRRLAAIFYDSVLVLALMAAAFTLVYLPLAVGLGLEDLRQYPYYKHLMTLWMLIVGVGFHLWFWTHGGQTLGMRAWRMRLFSADGGGVSLKQALIRYAVAILSLLAGGLGFLWILRDREKRAWHDLASHTRLVLVDPNRS
ncbi:RDD family protein [Thiolapillus sp.]